VELEKRGESGIISMVTDDAAGGAPGCTTNGMETAHNLVVSPRITDAD